MKKAGKLSLAVTVISVLSWNIAAFAYSDPHSEEYDDAAVTTPVQNQGQTQGQATVQVQPQTPTLSSIEERLADSLDEQGVSFPVIRVGNEGWKIRQSTNKYKGQVRQGTWRYLYSFSLQGDKKIGDRMLWVYPFGDLWPEDQRDIDELMQLPRNTKIITERTNDGYKYVLAENWQGSCGMAVGTVESPSGVKGFYVADLCALAHSLDKEMSKFSKVKLPFANDFPQVEYDSGVNWGKVRKNAKKDEPANTKQESNKQTKSQKAKRKARQ